MKSFLKSFLILWSFTSTIALEDPPLEKPYKYSLGLRIPKDKKVYTMEARYSILVDKKKLIRVYINLHKDRDSNISLLIKPVSQEVSLGKEYAERIPLHFDEKFLLKNVLIPLSFQTAQETYIIPFKIKATLEETFGLYRF